MICVQQNLCKTWRTIERLIGNPYLSPVVWKSFCYTLRQVVLASSDGNAQTFLLFVKNLDKDSRRRLLAGCLKVPFNIDMRQKVEKVIVVSVQKT